jgi:hypothetical protein
MKVYLNNDINHLIERAAERARANDGTPLQLAATDFERWRAALEAKCPEDWRFTQRAPDFILAVVTNQFVLKLLGRSYRWSGNAGWLQAQIRSLAHHKVRGEALDCEVYRLAEAFLNSETYTNATICHQIKSVLATNMCSTTDLGRLNKRKDGRPSNLVLDHSQIERNLAQRPNALLIEQSDGECEVWVRQGNPYIRALSGMDRSISFCIFARLTPDGIDSSVPGQVWKVTGGGALHKVGEADCHPTPRPYGACIPDGFRSDNYWRVPSHLAHWLDSLDFALDRGGDANGRRNARIAAIIERILARAEEINLERIHLGDQNDRP